jgi:acetyl-CoA carboxylase carboxyl transferase subunit alpha
VLPEPLGGAHRDPAQAAATLKKAIAGHLDRLAGVANGDRVDQRIRKYRKMGVFRSDEA